MFTVPECDNQNDRVLLHRIERRDQQAFERLYQRYTPRLTRYLRTFLESPELVEEVLHDVLLVVWQQAERYQATGRVSTWLFGIARHKACKAYARTMRPVSALPPAPEATNRNDPEHRMVRQECAHLVRQALAMLPPSEREVFLLTQEYGYPAQAIAVRQDCSIATVRYRLRQARRHLASILSAWEVGRN